MRRLLCLLAVALTAPTVAAQTAEDLNASHRGVQVVVVQIENGQAVYDVEGEGDALSPDIPIGGVFVIYAEGIPYAMMAIYSRLGDDPTDGPDVVIANRAAGPAALRISNDPAQEQRYVDFAVFACAEATEYGACVTWQRAVPRGSTVDDLLYNRMRIVGELPELGAPAPMTPPDPPVRPIDPQN